MRIPTKCLFYDVLLQHIYTLRVELLNNGRTIANIATMGFYSVKRKSFAIVFDTAPGTDRNCLKCCIEYDRMDRER